MKGTRSHVIVRARKAYRKLEMAKLLGSKVGKATVLKLSETGKHYARTIAPFYKGNTARFIVVRKKGTPKDVKAQIIAKNPTQGGANRVYEGGKYPNFNLVRWMHKTGGVFKSDNPFGKAGTQHIKSGDPKFMYTTRNYLNKIKKGVAKGQHRKLNLK